MPLLPASSTSFPLNLTNQLSLLTVYFQLSALCSKALSIHQIELGHVKSLNKHLNTVRKLLIRIPCHSACIVHPYIHSQRCLLRYYPPVKGRPRCHLLHPAFLTAPVESYFLFGTLRVLSLQYNSNGTCHILFGIWVLLTHPPPALHPPWD